MEVYKEYIRAAGTFLVLALGLFGAAAASGRYAIAFASMLNILNSNRLVADWFLSYWSNTEEAYANSTAIANSTAPLPPHRSTSFYMSAHLYHFRLQRWKCTHGTDHSA
jgi:hypothetical protein